MPPTAAIAAAKSVTPRDAPLAGLLFRLRGLPATRDVPIFRQMLAAGFVEVRETASELVLSAEGQPWRLRGGGAEGSFVRMTLRIAPEIFEQDVIAFRRRQLDEALGPELLEARKRHVLGGGARTHAVIDPLTPVHLVAVFGEGALIAEPLRQRAENVEIILRIRDRINGAMHGQNERIAG